MLAAAAIGGVLTGSLALLAEAGHVLSDVGAIGLALLAAAFAARSGGPRRTFGFQRTEVIAALVNGVTLVAIAVLIVVAAINRLGDPPSVEGAGVIVWESSACSETSPPLGVRARAPGRSQSRGGPAPLRRGRARSIGVVVSGVVILATGWRPIDPLVSIAIAAADPGLVGATGARASRRVDGGRPTRAWTSRRSPARLARSPGCGRFMSSTCGR